MDGSSNDAQSRGDEPTTLARSRFGYLKDRRLFRPVCLSIVWSTPTQKAPTNRCARRRAARSLACFVLVTLLLHAGAWLILDRLRPGIRDPEYARRIRRFQARIAENPNRPVIVCLGSSRTAAGICPAAWEAVRPNTPGESDPLLLNLGLAGSGPVMELLALRRLLNDGPVPSAILIEYWAPFLHGHGEWNERNRIGLSRLSPLDREVVQKYFPDPEVAESEMRRYQLNPIHANRECLLVQMLPDWLRRDRRADGAWAGIDSWGWLPNADLHPCDSQKRSSALAASKEKYRSLFEDYRMAANADRAIGEMVRLVREQGIAVAMNYLPESTEFRSWYSLEAERMAADHLDQLARELAVPVINARSWMTDDSFADGYHLTRDGAAEFTRRLGPAVRATFPEVKR